MTWPRLLVLIGSGEMAPGMRRVHRMVIERLMEGSGPTPIKATFVDTPYGFQENADDLSRSGVEFLRRLGLDGSAASFRRDGDVVARETALARIREAGLVFCGPGSPSYALRQWSGTPVADAFLGKVTQGGSLVFASAAALCLGRLTVPVYEIYKAGADPHWLPGLDVLSAIGLNVALIPHWNNAEGSGFDTRFCFLGERRLMELEAQLPDETHILGIDEHTALAIDIDSGRATVHGRGGVTVRARQFSRLLPTGAEISLDELRPTNGWPVPTRSLEHGQPGTDPATELAGRVLELEQRLADRARLADLAAPLVRAMLDMRASARAIGAFEAADQIRDRLLALGIEISDSPDGSSDFRLPES